MQDFTVTTVAEAGHVWRLAPHGEIDMEAWPELTRALTERPAVARTLLFDMDAVEFMDVTGLHLIAHARATARSEHVTISFTRWRPQPLRLLRLAEALFTGGSRPEPYAGRPRAAERERPVPSAAPARRG